MKNLGGGGPRFPRLQRPASSIQSPEPYAPRGASIPCGLSRLRILPVTTGVYPLRAGSEVQFVRGPAFDILYFVILAMKTE